MGWFILARYMHGFSDHICNIRALNISSGKEPIYQIIITFFICFQKKILEKKHTLASYLPLIHIRFIFKVLYSCTNIDATSFRKSLSTPCPKKQCSVHLKERIAIMERDGVQPSTMLLSSDDDIPNTP